MADEQSHAPRLRWKDIPGRPKPTWMTANPSCMTDCSPMSCSCLQEALAEWRREPRTIQHTVRDE